MGDLTLVDYTLGLFTLFSASAGVYYWRSSTKIKNDMVLRFSTLEESLRAELSSSVGDEPKHTDISDALQLMKIMDYRSRILIFPGEIRPIMRIARTYNIKR